MKKLWRCLLIGTLQMMGCHAPSVKSDSPPSASFSMHPTAFPLGRVTHFTLVNSGTTWDKATQVLVRGGDHAFISGVAIEGARLSGSLLPGTSAGPLDISTNSTYGTVRVFATQNVTTMLVFDGTSLTTGLGGANVGTVHATRLDTVLQALGPTVAGANAAVGGQTLQQMRSRLRSHTSALYSPGKTNFLVAEGGHNDIAQGADSKAIIERIRDYVDTARGLHPDWRIVWATEPPAANPVGYPSDFDRRRSEVNNYVRAHWKEMGIWSLSDFAEDAVAGQDGQEFNTTYYSASDHTHLTDAGYTRWGWYDLQAIRGRELVADINKP